MAANPWHAPDPEPGIGDLVGSPPGPDDGYTVVAALRNPDWWGQRADENWFAIFGEQQPRTDDDQSVNVAVRIGRDDSRLTITGVIVATVDEGVELTWRELRRIMTADDLFAALGADRWQRRGLVDPMLSKRAQSTAGRHPGRRGHDLDHFKKVAAFYVQALDEYPNAPMTATAEEFEVSASTARRWVTRARKLGLLNGEEG